jgi:hypothetical protein
MKGKRVFIAGVLLVAILAGTAVVAASGETAGIRRATARYRRVQAAQERGYEAFLECLSDPVAGGMGYHYVNFDIVDLALDANRPEALVYEPGPNGQLNLVAVEYIVPAEPWDAAGNNAPPTLLGQLFHLNEGLGVYVLHAWVWKENPSGLYEDYNPAVECD